MRAHGTEIGELLVGQRRPGAQFSGAERRLLRGLAGQAALAGEACRSTLDLQRAREQLVLAREEERRRLRRELHDGVSSGLVGARLLTSAAQHCGPGDARMPALLDELARDLESCTLEIRSLIDGLRPAALDNGLAAALSTTVARANGSTLTTTLFFDNAVGDLPAAVEVVAYRIGTEAVVNVTKHAAAQHCTVRVDRDGHLVRVSIDDDGRGLAASTALPAAPPSTGVGIASVRTRLDEVGGTLEIVSSTAGTSAALPSLCTRRRTRPGTRAPSTRPAGSSFTALIRAGRAPRRVRVHRRLARRRVPPESYFQQFRGVDVYHPDCRSSP